MIFNIYKQSKKMSHKDIVQPPDTKIVVAGISTNSKRNPLSSICVTGSISDTIDDAFAGIIASEYYSYFDWDTLIDSSGPFDMMFEIVFIPASADVYGGNPSYSDVLKLYYTYGSKLKDMVRTK